MLLSEKIRSMGPSTAVFFRLKLPMSNGADRIYPASGFFKIGESPADVPSGPYTLCFYDDGYQLIPYPEQAIHINLGRETHPPNQLNLHLLNAQGNPAQPGLHAKEAGAEQGPGPATGAYNAAALPQSALPPDVELEFRRHLQAMDIEERQQEFIKNSTYVTEVAELFTVNRLMRREMLEMHRIIVQHSSRAYQDIDHVKGTIHELLALQKAVLDHAAAQIAKPPVPPPDYVGLGHSALSMIKEIGVALIQRSHAKGSGAQLADSSAVPQLAAPAAEVSKAPAGPQVDVIAKMVEKLQGISDLDLAMAMSSPDAWKSLLDELREPNHPATSKDADKPAAGAE